MRSAFCVLTAVASAAGVHAATLADVCTTAYATAALPDDDFGLGIEIDTSSVVVSAVTNATASGSNMYPNGVYDYCSVTFSYAHAGRGDSVVLTLWLPTPDNFQNRWLSTGGGGLAINSGTSSMSSLPGGILYGAAAGLTDGGWGGAQMDAYLLLAPGVLEYETVFMFGYEAHHELTLIGKAFTKLYFDLADATKLYAYYQGCSEGGREGWSQIQRYTDWDGAITGAPAFRFAQQQVQHLYSNTVEQTLGYYPPPCELAAINLATIAACDSLDGLVDGVISRTDLCAQQFDISDTIGTPYNCSATAGGGGFPGGPPATATPAQIGNVSAEGVAVAKTILHGLRNSAGEQVYLSYQIGASYVDAATAYDNDTGSWTLDVSGLGAEYPVRFLELQNSSSFATAAFDNVTYDTLEAWMAQGTQMYYDTLQTTNPDLTPFYENGGKIIHFHGEVDDSIPTASSVRYHESVREVMYPNLTFAAGNAALNEWYKLFIVPGAQHCAPSTIQTNGSFPQTNLGVLIEWVENGVEPVTLNATHLAGPKLGENGQICAFPARPKWSAAGVMSCVQDEAGAAEFIYDLNAWKVPIY